jgi:hypothetical protein
VIGFQCATCGEWHDQLPFAYGADEPYDLREMPEDERARRALSSNDQCVLDGQSFFVRASIELPVLDAAQPFSWGVWVSVSEDDFDRMHGAWEDEGRESAPPFSGTLATSLPTRIYPPSLGLDGEVQTQPVGIRPLFELGPADHPLVREQRAGITIARVTEFAATLLHTK